LTITALRDLVHGFAWTLLALPYYFFKEKMEFLGQSPSLERRKAMRYGDGYGRYVTDWGRRIPSLGACKETGDIAGANFQEYVPFPISQDAGERTADLICNPGKKKVSSERIGEVAASRRTNRKTIRADIIKQTDSENQEKYNNCFCIIFSEKRKWTIPDNTYGLPMEVCMNLPVHERIKI
jgi:hypothetical protein